MLVAGLCTQWCRGWGVGVGEWRECVTTQRTHPLVLGKVLRLADPRR